MGQQGSQGCQGYGRTGKVQVLVIVLVITMAVMVTGAWSVAGLGSASLNVSVLCLDHFQQALVKICEILKSFYASNDSVIRILYNQTERNTQENSINYSYSF